MIVLTVTGPGLASAETFHTLLHAQGAARGARENKGATLIVIREGTRETERWLRDTRTGAWTHVPGAGRTLGATW